MTAAVVIGESLVDLVWPAGAASPEAVAGGSPANVAVGLHRLDRPVTLVTCWGDDPPGQLVERHLRGTGADLVRVPSRSGRTTIALAYLDGSGAANYQFLPAWDPAEIPLPDDARLLHTGSLAAVLQPGAEQVRAACADFRARPGAVVALDLNVRPSVEPDHVRYRTILEELIAVADLVKASDEDLTWLWPERSPEESAQALLAQGPRLSVLTRGEAGAVGFTAQTKVSASAPPTRVVDTIGAGDSFQAALLAGLLADGGAGNGVRLPLTAEELEPVLRRAVVAGALATTRAGAQPPTTEELDAAMPNALST